MDMTPTIVPKSDQLNAEDFIAAPVTVTIAEVTKGNADQPVNVVTKEFGPKRPFKPSKSMRRVMVAAWGADTTAYAGRSLTLYRDPSVRWAGEEVGGIRISAMSNIPEPLSIALTVTRGHRASFIVQPLDPPKPQVDESGRDWLKELADTQGDVDAINALGSAAKAAHAKEATLTVIRSAYKDALATSQEPQS